MSGGGVNAAGARLQVTWEPRTITESRSRNGWAARKGPPARKPRSGRQHLVVSNAQDLHDVFKQPRGDDPDLFSTDAAT